MLRAGTYVRHRVKTTVQCNRVIPSRIGLFVFYNTVREYPYVNTLPEKPVPECSDRETLESDDCVELQSRRRTIQ